jgi:hypothetical protein
MPSGTILCVDQRFSDWFGKTPEECVGRAFASLGAEQDKLLRWGRGRGPLHQRRALAA